MIGGDRHLSESAGKPEAPSYGMPRTLSFLLSVLSKSGPVLPRPEKIPNCRTAGPGWHETPWKPSYPTGRQTRIDAHTIGRL